MRPIFQAGSALTEALPGPGHHRPGLPGPALGLAPALLRHPAPVRPLVFWQLRALLQLQFLRNQQQENQGGEGAPAAVS